MDAGNPKRKKQRMEGTLSPSRGDVASASDTGTPVVPVEPEDEQLAGAGPHADRQIAGAVPREWMASMEAKMKEAEAERAAMKKEIETLANQGKKTEQRLNYITGIFEPATNHALLETSIHTFVVIPQGWEEEAVQIRYSTTIICNRVLEIMVTGRDRNFQWQGPPKKKFPFVRDAVLRGLGALVAYIESMDLEEFRNWPPPERNQLVHNGRFLDSLFKSPDDRDASLANHDAKKAMVKRTRREFKNKSESFTIYRDLDDGMDHVVRALQEKGLLISDRTKQLALNQLKPLY